MTIIHLVCVYPPYKSGIGHAAQVFARQTAALGHRSVVVTPDYRLKDQAQYNDPGVEVRRLRPVLQYGNGAFIPQLLRAARNADIVYLHYPFYGGQEPLYLARALGLIKARIAIHYHMDTPGLDGVARFLSLPSGLTSHALFRRAKIITAASLDYVAHSNLGPFFKSHKDKFRELPFAVDTALFRPLERPGAPKNILFVGALDRAHSFKGLPVLMRAFKGFLGQGMRLRIVGDGDMKAYYQESAKRTGIQRETLFLGKLSLPGLVKEYQGAGLTVLPSTDKNEAFGIVLIESLACGTPVVASDLPGVRQVFRPGINGRLVPPNDEAALAEGMKEIFAGQGRWKLMAKAARDMALERYSLEAFRKGLENVYDSV